MNDIVVDLDELEEPQEAEQPEPEEKPRGRFDDWDRETAIKNYQELEKLKSRHDQEVGRSRQEIEHLKKTVAELSKPQQPVEKIDVDSLLENPDEAFKKSIESNPKVQELENRLAQIQQAEAVSRLKSTHPDFMEVVNSKEYQDWVMESPVRTDLHYKANNYDYDAGNELLSTFKERQKYIKTEHVKEELEQGRKESLRAASSEGAGSGSPSSKIYREVDLIRLNQNDPEKYDAMLPEIIRAYSEGRVK